MRIFRDIEEITNCELDFLIYVLLSLTVLSLISPQKRGIENPDLVQSQEEVRFEEEDLITEQGDDPSEVTVRVINTASVLV